MSTPTAVVDDYYELFDIDADADRDSIRTTLQAARRRWSQVTGSPDRERARRAEQRMEQLEAAETALLDDTRRAAYDARLRVAVAPAAAPPDAMNWGERAKDYYDDGDVRNALKAAKQGTDVDRKSVLAWRVYAWAATDLGRYEDAEYATAQLARLMPEVDTVHELRGGVLEAMGRYAQAEHSFRTAAALSPDNAYYPARAAWAVLRRGRRDAAITEAWRLVARFPDEASPRMVLRAGVESLREVGRLQDALDLAAAVFTRFPGDDETIGRSVMIVHDLEAVDPTQALSEAWRLLGAHPDDTRTQRGLRYVIAGLSRRGRGDIALAEARRLMERYPQDEHAKSTYAAIRLAEAESRMTQKRSGERLIINRAQARYYGEAIREVAASGSMDPEVARALADMRAYLSEQSRVRVTLSFGRVVLGVLAVVVILGGLGGLTSGGLLWVLLGALLAWQVSRKTFPRQYELNYHAVRPGLRTRGLAS